MKRTSPLIFSLTLLLAGTLHAAPADALRIEKNYQSAMERWTLQVRAAATQADRNKLLESRPDVSAYVRQMWNTIGNSLGQDWTLEPAAWFLRASAGILATDGAGLAQPVFANENEAIRKAIEDHYLASPKLGPVCAALASSPNPRSLAVLEKIQDKNPDKKIQGIAAFGAALQLKTLGDNPRIMTKRLTYLRKAIIQSSDMEIEGMPISKLAADELYVINNLSKGRVAPDLVGVDSGNRPLTLSSQAGKVIILTFWNSNLENSQRVVDMTTALQKEFQGRPLVVLGVNNDTVEKLRKLESDGTVPWKSFADPDNQVANQYRVGSRPIVYVLDGERRIHYVGTPGSFVEATAEALLEGPKGPPKKP